MDNAREKVIIAGGSGFLGMNLAPALAGSGYDVRIVSRSRPAADGDWKHVPWDGRTVGDWSGVLEGAKAIVNLAGRSVDCVKTPDHRDEILRSRVESTRAIGQALLRVKNPPTVWVQMSTAHIYGDPPTTVCDEDSATGHGLAPFVGRAWEEAYRAAALPEMRQVILRTSFVLGQPGGALRHLAFLARIGLGGTVGRGKQGISWLHQDDMNRLFLRAIEDGSMRGTYVATAPNPVSNAEFMRHLRKALGVPFGLPATEWMVRVGAPLVMKTDPELALYGRYCVSKRLADEGFEFAFTDVALALQDVFSDKPSS
jgi:uncharacterized protein (TIGR01777 family)